jgi:hypothetical protein
VKYFYYCTFFVENKMNIEHVPSALKIKLAAPVPLLPPTTTQPRNGITHTPTSSVSDHCDDNTLGIDASDDRGIWVIHKLSLQFFCSRLVEHFDIIYKQNRINWPSRAGLAMPAAAPSSWL